MIEYFSQNLWQVWAIIAVVCLILELFSGDFFILCFSIGAVVSLITALCGLSLTGQIIVFAVASVLSVLFVRPVALKYFHRNDPDRVSNADAIVGREGRVSEAIEAGVAPDLIRLSVGIEDVSDIIDDLSQALDKI